LFKVSILLIVNILCVRGTKTKTDLNKRSITLLKVQTIFLYNNKTNLNHFQKERKKQENNSSENTNARKQWLQATHSKIQQTIKTKRQRLKFFCTTTTGGGLTWKHLNNR